MRYIYVAGPYTKGDVALNVKHALYAATVLFAMGYMPYVPHLTHFWHLIYPHDYEDWMRLDFEWIRRCDALLRLSGESAGADREVAFATELGIPVFYAVEELCRPITQP